MDVGVGVVAVSTRPAARMKQPLLLVVAEQALADAGLPQLVVVSTTQDPATPYQAGVDLAKQLGAALITFDGTQHTVVLDGNSCVDDAVVDYFVYLKAPEEGLTC
jgi:predicted alpha/beta hydrolase family esterase